jgi:hypothetical protein
MISFRLDDSTICFVNLVTEQNSVQELSYPQDAVIILDRGMRERVAMVETRRNQSSSKKKKNEGKRGSTQRSIRRNKRLQPSIHSSIKLTSRNLRLHCWLSQYFIL